MHTHRRFRTLVPLVLTAACGTALALAAPASAATSATPAPIRQLARADLDRLAHARQSAHTSAQVAASDANRKGHQLPSFSGSYVVNGTTYPYTMLGSPPVANQTTRLKTVLVPLRMVFSGFAVDVTFEPSFAVQNTIMSPLYRPAPFLNGSGQFTDQFQRAEFWNQMNPAKGWHTLLADPRVSQRPTITVTPATGQLYTYNGGYIGNMNINDLNAQLHAILPTLNLAPDETPVFITQGVTADALGYHDAFVVPDGRGGARPQTLIYASWLDPNQVGTLLGDVSTLNHEIAEWVDDPFIFNYAPLWAFPPYNQVCGNNPYLEVGDPQGNGPDYALFPTVPVTISGYTYHLQDLALLQWFSRETPSSAYQGWYAFPDPTQLTTPSVDCPTP